MKNSFFVLFTFLSFLFSCEKKENSALSPKETEKRDLAFFPEKGISIKKDSALSPKETEKWDLAFFPEKDISIKEIILVICKLISDVHFSKGVIGIEGNATTVGAALNLPKLVFGSFDYNKLKDKHEKAKKIIEIKNRFNRHFPKNFFEYLHEIKTYPSNMFNITGLIFLEYFLKPMWNIFKNNENSIDQNILKDLEQKAKEIKIFRDYLLNYDEKNQEDFKNLEISKRVLMGKNETEMFRNLADKEKLQKVSEDHIEFNLDCELSSNSDLEEFSPKEMMGFHFDPIRELLDEGLEWANNLVGNARNKLDEPNKEAILETRIQLRNENLIDLPDNFKRFTSDYFYKKRRKNYEEILDKVSKLIDQEMELYETRKK